MNPFDKIFGEISPEERDENNKVFDGDLDTEIAAIKALHNLLSDKEHFEPGDVVKWKEGLRNRIPEYGQPMIVLGTTTLTDLSHDECSPFHGEPIDLKVLYRDKPSNQFMVMNIDARTVTLHPGVLSPKEKNILDKLKAKKTERESKRRPKGLPQEEQNRLIEEHDAREAAHSQGD